MFELKKNLRLKYLKRNESGVVKNKFLRLRTYSKQKENYGKRNFKSKIKKEYLWNKLLKEDL